MSLIGTSQTSQAGTQSPGRMLDHGISETFVVLLPALSRMEWKRYRHKWHKWYFRRCLCIHTSILVHKCWYESTGDAENPCKGLRLSSMMREIITWNVFLSISNAFNLKNTTLDETTETSAKVTVALGALATGSTVAVAAGSTGAASGTAATAAGDFSSAKGRSVLRNMGAVLEAMTLAHPERDMDRFVRQGDVMHLLKNSEFLRFRSLD